MKSAVACQEEILRAAVETHGGHVVKLTGDGVVPHDAEARRRTGERLASIMGSNEYTIAFDAGRALDLDEAVGLAHGVLDELAAGT